MTLEYLIATYGYLALFIGTFLEGETICIIAGFAAYNGHLSLPWVIVTAFAGTFFGDQLYFYIGRYNKDRFMRKAVRWRERICKVHNLLEKHQVLLILGFRFLYGFRNITPFAIGTSKVSAVKYFILNFIGAGIWAISFGLGGYHLGQVMEKFIEDAKRVQIYILGGIILVAAIFWLIKSRRRAKADSEDKETNDCK